MSIVPKLKRTQIDGFSYECPIDGFITVPNDTIPRAISRFDLHWRLAHPGKRYEKEPAAAKPKAKQQGRPSRAAKKGVSKRQSRRAHKRSRVSMDTPHPQAPEPLQT